MVWPNFFSERQAFQPLVELLKNLQRQLAYGWKCSAIVGADTGTEPTGLAIGPRSSMPLGFFEFHPDVVQELSEKDFVSCVISVRQPLSLIHI